MQSGGEENDGGDGVAGTEEDSGVGEATGRHAGLRARLQGVRGRGELEGVLEGVLAWVGGAVEEAVDGELGSRRRSTVAGASRAAGTQGEGGGEFAGAMRSLLRRNRGRGASAAADRERQRWRNRGRTSGRRAAPRRPRRPAVPRSGHPPRLRARRPGAAGQQEAVRREQEDDGQGEVAGAGGHHLAQGPAKPRAKAVLLLSRISSKLVGDPIERERVHDAVDCLLSFVNKDGTFSTYECKRTSAWIEILNPCESFPNMIIDHPYPECTSSVLQALVLFKEQHSGYRTKEIEKCITNAAKFIESRQGEDGSWLGTWGVCFTYGAFFSVKALVAAGRTYENSSSIRKACHFILSKQLKTGGWGESHVSNETKAYVNIEGDRAHAVNTAWAMLTLIYAGQIERDSAPLHRAAKELINMQMDTGDFPQQEHVGCFNCSLFFNYPNYRNLFPVWALGEYRRRLCSKSINGSPSS